VNPVAATLLTVGVAVAVGSAVGALVARDLRVRLHFLTPVTSLAGPLVGAAVVVDAGMGSTAVQAVLVVVLLAVTGPVLTVATGRLLAGQDRR
jgi:multisubunit Na+/H+ antiporter MnhG subunit